MLHHVSVGVSDVERAAKFYDAVLGAFGYKRVMEFLPYAVAYGEDHPAFWVQLPHNRSAATVGNGVHVGFVARTQGAGQQIPRRRPRSWRQQQWRTRPAPRLRPGLLWRLRLRSRRQQAGSHADGACPRRRRKQEKPRRRRKKSAKKPAKKAAKKAAPKKKGEAQSQETLSDKLVRCPWPGEDPLYVAYHDTGMGRAGVRRPGALRKARARRLPGGPFLDHDPAQAREFPQRLRRLRSREDRALRQTRFRPR